MAQRSSFAFVAALAAVCLFGGNAAALTQSKCVQGKNKCMSKKADSLLKCHVKAETPGKPANPNDKGCEDKARAKFDGTPDPAKGCFEKLENKNNQDCVTFNDTAQAEAVVDNCVQQLVAAIDPGPITQTKCGAGKKKCVAKKLKSILKCYEKAQKPGAPMDPNTKGCIDKAMDKFDGGAKPEKGCFVKLETKSNNDCQPPTGNQAALEELVDGSSCVGAFIALLDGPATTTTTTLAPTTTTGGPTTTTQAPTTSTTMTPVTTTTTTTGGSVTPAFLDFTTGTPGGTCGTTQDGSSAVIKNLTCGGLNIGGGGSVVAEGPTPDGSVSRFAISCTGNSCTISPTSVAPPVNTAGPDCTDVGCNFGTPLPIPNPGIPSLTTCVHNTWASPASGTLDLGTGVSTTNVNLTSDIYLTGNLAQPCPQCSGSGSPGSPGTGTCDRGPRATMACTSTNSEGYTRDCPSGGVGSAGTPCPGGPGNGSCPANNCPCGVGGGNCCDGSHVGPINVNLSPLTTSTATDTDPAGIFCLGQTSAGCFGSGACRTITENGSPAGPITVGTPASATLASVFCIAATGNGLVDASAALPGPGAVSLPGTFVVN